MLVRGGEIVSPRGRYAADVLIRDGRIAAIGNKLEAPRGAEIVDAGGLQVLPGIIDCHSHLWEAGFMSGPDFADSTASAVAGGITTVIDMPLTVPEVLDVGVFEEKAALGERTSHCDFALHAGVHPGNLGELEAMWDAGATAFKIFTCDTGCPMAGVIDDGDLLDALATIGGFGGLATFHAENEALLKRNLARVLAEGRTDNLAYAVWRNELVELEAIQRILLVAEFTKTRVNIVHMTSSRGLELVREARGRGVEATAETCPHYLYFTTADMEARGTWVACAPPVRGPEELPRFREMVAEGFVQTIGSDHGPVDPALKRRGDNNILQGQAGFPGNETMVPLMLNLAAEGALTLERVVELVSEAPARLYGLYPRKGAIEVGADGDLTLVDTSAEWTVRSDDLIGKSGWTPYEEMRVRGRVAATIVRGRVRARDGRTTMAPGEARLVRRRGARDMDSRPGG